VGDCLAEERGDDDTAADLLAENSAVVEAFDRRGPMMD
jgi:hypothetical protein